MVKGVILIPLIAHKPEGFILAKITGITIIGLHPVLIKIDTPGE
jgi:hypothetical protein